MREASAPNSMHCARAVVPPGNFPVARTVKYNPMNNAFARTHKLNICRDYMRTLAIFKHRLLRKPAWWATMICCMFCCSPLTAQTVSASSQPATATIQLSVPASTTQAPQVTAAAPPPANVALIDPAKEKKGAALLEALRKGGFNLYMRHALSTVGQDGNLIQTPRWWENCEMQRNIADAGREQARKLGAALKELKIPISAVLTAQFCRTRDTGHALGLGPIEITEDLNHQIGQRAGFDVNAARYKQLAELPPMGTNRVLVSHTHGSPKPEERIMGSLQEAEIVVYQPDNRGGVEPLARIPLTEWDNLVKLAATNRP
jgi:phosphohistidine phosphatase SixA